MAAPPRRLGLAQRPTPLQHLARLSAELGLSVAVKRDDLTGSHLSGNKIRKLEYLLAEALDAGATHVLTCGGVQSNHCRATALAAAPLGLRPVLLLRTATGDRAGLPSPPSGNVLLGQLAGSIVEVCDPVGYGDREARLEALAARISAAGGTPYVVPEGGSNALGAWGYVEAAREIAAQSVGAPPDSVVVATGSGGTLAGLAIGMRALGLPTRCVGVAVCDGEATFRAIVHRISAEATARWELPRLRDEDFEVVDGYQGRGYALSTPDELQILAGVARQDGLVLDPVYTGKAFCGLLDMAASSPDRLGQRVVFLHTGGVFGLLAAGEDLAHALGPLPGLG